METAPNSNNINYLRTKRDKLGHLLGNVDAPAPGPERRE
jgi:hypothetical protein